MKNYYSLLGIEENASIEQINEAYRKLAQKFHPDRNNNDPYFTSLFKQINDAKQILTDPEKNQSLIYCLLIILTLMISLLSKDLKMNLTGNKEGSS